MGSPTGFIKHEREDAPRRPVAERVKDFAEVEQPLSEERLETQAARCMDCGIPYCHMHGCPIRSLVPDFNDMVYRGRWRRALDLLHAHNNLPEITGRICPALCEASCTLSINQKAVTIRQIELQIVERGWKEGWIQPEPAPVKSGKRVAVVGSGPAGLVAAQQLARAGHEVVVFERDERPGGILRYGIPDFKLEKRIIDRRLEQMRGEGVAFETGVEAGVDISARYLLRSFNAVLIAVGARAPRDLEVPGRGLQGVHQAMAFLMQQNRISEGEGVPAERRISAEGKNVVIIGGGDTGADCIGTCRRQGAADIQQIELLPQPPAGREPDNPWPMWPLILRTSSSHDEGCVRLWSVATREFIGNAQGRLRALRCVKLDWSAPDASGRRTFKEVPGSEFELKAELALLAMGFVHPEHGRLVKDLDLALDERGNIKVDADLATSTPRIFACGDAVAGASLVVRAIDSGRRAAESLARHLAT